MKSSTVTKLEFCFPKASAKIEKADLVKRILEQMQRSGSIEYAGYMTDEGLQADLLMRLGDTVDVYRPLTAEQKKKIGSTIESAMQKSMAVLPLSELPVHVFVFPWFPSTDDRKAFGGVTAVAPYASTLHLFVSPHRFTYASLKETVVHEFNHLAFYQAQPAQSYPLAAHMVMEGLAEVFREEVVGGKPAPWSVALTKGKARDALKTLMPLLASKSEKVHAAVLFGNTEYKRWTGYSVGYWFVQTYRKENPTQTWDELVHIKPKQLLGI